MQKRPYYKDENLERENEDTLVTIKYEEVFLESAFPIAYYRYKQGHQDLKRVHYHNGLEIGLCLEGAGLFFINNNVLPFKQNDISIIFPKQAHIAQSPDEIPSDWYFITVDIDKIITDKNICNAHFMLLQEELPNIFSREQHEDIFSIVNMIIRELEKEEQNYQQVIIQLLTSLLFKIIRLKSLNRSYHTFLPTEFASIAPALHYISTFYNKEIASQKLAELCHLSPTHFRRVFKRATQYSPHQYLAYVRMNMAKTLLRSTRLSVINIAQNVGYSSITSFNRTFKTFFCVTPTQYRR